MNAKEIEGTDSEKNAIQLGQNECLFHQIQRYHYEFKKSRLTSLQIIKFNDIIAK